MRGRPGCLLQFAGGEANRILLASTLSSMRIICPNRVSRRDWIIAVMSLGCFVSLRASSFRTNWYHLMPSLLIVPIDAPLCMVRLCNCCFNDTSRLIDKLSPGKINWNDKTFQVPKIEAMRIMRERERIAMFSKLVQEYGVPDAATFPTESLHEKGALNLAQVCVCLRTLGIEVRPVHDHTLAHYGDLK